MVYSHYFSCSCPVFPAQLIEGSVFSPLYFFASLVANQLIIKYVGFPDLSILSHSYMPVFVPVPCCFDWEDGTSSFVLLFEDFFGNTGYFVVTYDDAI